MAPFFGNSVACRLGAAHEINHSTLVLGDWRAAQRIEFALGGNSNGVVGSSGGGLRKGAAAGVAGAGAGAVAAAMGGGAEAPLKFWVVNTHLDHYHTDNRQRQVRGGVGPAGEGQGRVAGGSQFSCQGEQTKSHLQTGLVQGERYGWEWMSAAPGWNRVQGARGA
jgi:hypothetical protein